MRRMLKIAIFSLTVGFAAFDVQAQPPLPPVPAPPVPGPARVVRDVDRQVRRAAPVRRRVRRHHANRHRRVVRRRASAVTLRPPVRGLPTIRVPKPPIPR